MCDRSKMGNQTHWLPVVGMWTLAFWSIKLMEKYISKLFTCLSITDKSNFYQHFFCKFHDRTVWIITICPGWAYKKKRKGVGVSRRALSTYWYSINLISGMVDLLVKLYKTNDFDVQSGPDIAHKTQNCTGTVSQPAAENLGPIKNGWSGSNGNGIKEEAVWASRRAQTKQDFLPLSL